METKDYLQTKEYENLANTSNLRAEVCVTVDWSNSSVVDDMDDNLSIEYVSNQPISENGAGLEAGVECQSSKYLAEMNVPRSLVFVQDQDQDKSEWGYSPTHTSPTHTIDCMRSIESTTGAPKTKDGKTRAVEAEVGRFYLREVDNKTRAVEAKLNMIYKQG